jgi:hypothetical protein
VAESGTAEEIEEFRRAGKPVLLYFSLVPVTPDSVDAAQYKALVAYRKRLENEGIIWRYETIASLRDQLSRHLTGLDVLWGKRDAATSVPERNDRAMLAEEFESFLRRLRAEWQTEKNVQPTSTDHGKSILNDALRSVLDYQSRDLAEANPEFLGLLRDASVKLRSLDEHRVSMSGSSYEEFWKLGDQAIRVLDAAARALHRVPETTQTQLSDEHLQILKRLAAEGVARSAEELGRHLGLGIERVRYLLDSLLEQGLVLDRLTVGAPTRYQLSRNGRKFAADRGII